MTTRLQRRQGSGIYYCRAAVPKELIPIIGKREIKISLKTADPALARQRLVLESFNVDQQLAAARGETVHSLVLPEVSVTRATNKTYSTVGNVTLHELTERYFAAPEQRNLAVKTKLEYGIRFKTIKALLGERTPIGSITREDCRQFQQTVMILPPNTSKRFPKMKLNDVVEHAKRHGLAPMAPKTVNQHISCLNLLMEWACRERLLDANPARGLFVEENVKLRDKRDPFTIDQLNQLFGHEQMRSYRAENSARFWIPMLALWTGARLNELCQLHTADVQMRDGIHALLIHEGNGNRLKTINANRVIPVHPMLIELGFIEYVEAVRERRKERLFDELSTSVRGYPSEVFSKWFTRYLKNVKVKTDRTCFHSFRHNFRDAMREAGISRELVQAIGGWSVKGSGTEEVYGKGFSVERLYDAIKCISFPGLDIYENEGKQPRKA